MCANVDFIQALYMTCLIFQLICYPIFAIARVVGLCAHIIEERINGERIIRPAYINVRERAKYVKLSERK